MKTQELALAIGLALTVAGAPALAKPKAKPKKETPIGQLAESQAKTADRGRLDQAIAELKSESYEAAVVALHALGDDPTQAAFTDEIQFQLGKGLYRLELHHAALSAFERVLAKGPTGKFYKSALEWCLFIARKMRGDDRVLALVAKHSDGTFPDEYKNEFRFALSRHHYGQALAIERGEAVGSLGETRVEKTVTGGRSFEGDVFSGGGEEPEPAPKKEKDDGAKSFDLFGDEEPAEKKPKKGLSLDEDLFGDEEKKPEKPAPKPEAPAEKPADGELTAKEHLELASRLVVMVEPDSPFGPRAKFLEGVLLYKRGQDNEALEAFKAVVRATKDLDDAEAQRLRQLAFFQLARTHFGAGQPSFSIYYYDKIERLTYEWLEALYEASWAEFRLGNFEKSLGNLLTLHSPFFRDQYFPESMILKAVVYYENCRYPEAKAILTDFLKVYEPIHEELKGLTQRVQTPEKYYETLKNLRSGDLLNESAEKAELMGRILSIALDDPELAKLDAAYREVDAELARYAALSPTFAQSKLKASLDGEVGKIREAIHRTAGKAVKRRLEQEREAIRTLIEQSVRIEVETARAEQERMESALRDADQRPKAQSREFVEWADDEKLVWPFEEEYWRDELGTYQLTLAQSCQ